MDDSPIAELLAAVDRLDLESATALFTPDAHLLTADGQRAAGVEEVRRVLAELFAGLHKTTHEITAQWHVDDDTWIAEVDATYELDDWMQTSPLPRALVLRQGAAGIVDLRVYGAHERPLDEHPGAESGTWIHGHWVPPL